jgi:hypothetical protein
VGPFAPPVPLLHGFDRPVHGLVAVAAGLVVARVGHAEISREIRTRIANAVVGAPVHHHVGLLGHVALDAQPAGAGFAFMDLLVEVVVRCVVGPSLVALQAQLVVFLVPFQAVHVVAVAATNARSVHFALHKRGVNVHLFQNLAVREVQPLAQERRHQLVQ